MLEHTQFNPMVGVYDADLIHDEAIDYIQPSDKENSLDEPILLGDLDMGVAFLWTPILVPFTEIGNKGMGAEELKSSLAKVLNQAPILTGKLEPVDGTPLNKGLGPNSQLQVTKGKGAWVTSETFDQPLSEFVASNFNYEKLPKQAFFPTATRAVVEKDNLDFPLFWVKLNYFNDNSLLIACSTCHLIADGRSIYELISCWGQLHRNLELSEDEMLTDIRHLFKPNDTMSGRSQWLLNDLKENQRKVLSKDNSQINKKGLCRLRVSIDQNKIGSLKQEVNRLLSPNWISSDDLGCAAIWRALIRARCKGYNVDIATSTETKSLFTRVLDIRHLNQPPISKLGFGNGIMPYSAGPMIPSKLVDSPLHEIAYEIRQVMGIYNPDLLADIITAIHHLPVKTHPLGGSSTMFGWDTFASSYRGFSAEKIKFSEEQSALTVTRGFYGDGMIGTQPISTTADDGEWSWVLGASEDYAQFIREDSELSKLGFIVS